MLLNFEATVPPSNLYKVYVYIGVGKLEHTGILRQHGLQAGSSVAAFGGSARWYLPTLLLFFLRLIGPKR